MGVAGPPTMESRSRGVMAQLPPQMKIRQSQRSPSTRPGTSSAWCQREPVTRALSTSRRQESPRPTVHAAQPRSPWLLGGPGRRVGSALYNGRTDDGICLIAGLSSDKLCPYLLFFLKLIVGGLCFKYLFDVLRAPREVNKQTFRFRPEMSAEGSS